MPETQLIVDSVCLPLATSFLPLVEQVFILVVPVVDRFCEGVRGKCRKLLPSTCTEVDGRFRKQELNIASKTVFIAISQRAEEVRKLPTQRNAAVQSINWRLALPLSHRPVRGLPQNPPILP